MIFVMVITNNAQAQQTYFSEKYGNTLNIGTGIGYYGYTTHSIAIVHVDYEFDIVKNFTLAPFIVFYSYQDNYYRQTVVPIGLKGTYYFDQFIKAGSKWDFYLAASLGFAVKNTTWNNNYLGIESSTIGAAPLYLNFSIGSEYHINKTLGAFLDLSSTVSTIGISIHKL